MCVYGIGLPFDHPIWQNLPPRHCGVGGMRIGPTDTRWNRLLERPFPQHTSTDWEAVKQMLRDRPCCDDPEHMGHGGLDR